MTKLEIEEIKNVLALNLIILEDERKKMLLEAKRNKYLFALMIFFGLLYGFMEIHSWTKGFVIIGLFLDIVLASITAILFLTTKPYELLNYKKNVALKNKYKYEIIKTVIKNYNSEFQYYSICKTNLKTLLNCELFGNQIDEQNEEDKIWGTINEHDFILTKIHLRKGLGCIFKGLFGIITLKEFYNENEETKKSTKNLIELFKTATENDIQINIKGKRIFMAIKIKNKLFELILNKSLFNNELLEYDIKIIYETLGFIDRITKNYEKV